MVLLLLLPPATPGANRDSDWENHGRCAPALHSPQRKFTCFRKLCPCTSACNFTKTLEHLQPFGPPGTPKKAAWGRTGACLARGCDCVLSRRPRSPPKSRELGDISYKFVQTRAIWHKLGDISLEFTQKQINMQTTPRTTPSPATPRPPLAIYMPRSL